MNYHIIITIAINRGPTLIWFPPRYKKYNQSKTNHDFVKQCFPLPIFDLATKKNNQQAIRDFKRNGQSVSKGFAKLFARRGTQTRGQLYDSLEWVSTDCLRRSRVRLDCVCMNLFRLFWATLIITSVDIYLFADGSPQWRGLELFAASMDLHIFGMGIIRKLLPCVSLPRWMASALSKCIAFLWQVFLMVGPSYSDVRNYCNRVRSITTDMGAERLMSGHGDVLIEFYECWLGIKLHPSVHAAAPGHLFPRSIQIHGWKHLWDNLIQRGLTSLPWFPKWLDRLKALVAFLRSHSIQGELCSNFRERGCQPLPSPLPIPHTFAMWRLY